MLKRLWYEQETCLDLGVSSGKALTCIFFFVRQAAGLSHCSLQYFFFPVSNSLSYIHISRNPVYFLNAYVYVHIYMHSHASFYLSIFSCFYFFQFITIFFTAHHYAKKNKIIIFITWLYFKHLSSGLHGTLLLTLHVVRSTPVFLGCYKGQCCQ